MDKAYFVSSQVNLAGQTVFNADRDQITNEVDAGISFSGPLHCSLGLTEWRPSLPCTTIRSAKPSVGRRTRLDLTQRRKAAKCVNASLITALLDGKNQQTLWKYDEYGRMTNKVYAAGVNAFIYRYDSNGRLTNRVTAAKGSTSYGYDPLGNLTNIGYASSSPIRYRYDGLNRLTNMIDSVGSTAFTWTPGNLLAAEDGPWASDAASYSYANRVRTGVSVQQPNASAWVQTYGFDPFGRLTNTTSPAGSFTYQYTVSSQPFLISQLTYPSGAFSVRWYNGLGADSSLYSANNDLLDSHSYRYDEGFQRTQQVFQAYNWTAYTYDNIGQLKTAIGHEANGADRYNESFNYLYDAAGNLSQRIFPNGNPTALTENFGVNNLNEITNISRTGKITVSGTTASAATDVTVNGFTAQLYSDNTFACTNAGLSLVDGLNTYTAVANDSLGRTDTDSVTVFLPTNSLYSYDANGNLLSDGNRNFAYDDENQLISVWVTNAWRSDFAYDGMLRRRIRREFTWTGSWLLTNEVHYIYDGLLVIEERDINNLPQVTYTRGTDLSGEIQEAGGIGGLLARSDNSLPQSPHAYYHTDGNGNVTCLIDTNSAIAAVYSYDPFGNLIAKNGSLCDANLNRFSSKETDTRSGLYYYLYRFYDPTFQRWCNKDPLEEEGGLNLYAYVENAPTHLDPLGESSENRPPASCSSSGDAQYGPPLAEAHHPAHVGVRAEMMANIWNFIDPPAPPGVLVGVMPSYIGGPRGPRVHSVYRDGTKVLKGQRPPRIKGPQTDAPHTVLRWDEVNKRVYQAREYGANKIPILDIDFTSPTLPNGTPRPGHAGPPHVHYWDVNDPKIGPPSGFCRGKQNYLIP